MPEEYRVKQGEDISCIAEKYGLSEETIWNDPANAELKEKRKDPNILYPGDVVMIPDKQLKEESGSSEQRHRFRKKTATVMLRLQLLDDDDSPRANLRYIIEIDGHFEEGTTDGDGKLEHPIPSDAKTGVLLVGDDDMIPLSFGDLDPIETVSGVQHRLLNLGFDCGEINGELDSETREALMEFQQKYGLTESGQIDQTTKDKLLEVHGS